MSGVDNKVLHIYRLLDKLYQGEELYAQKQSILDELDVSSRTLSRYIDTVQRLFGTIIVLEKKQVLHAGKKTTILRAPNPTKDASKVIRFFMETQSDLSWILSLANKNDPTLLNDISTDELKGAIESTIEADKDVFLFRSNPLENFQDSRVSHHFNTLKKAVKNRDYRTITYHYNDTEVLEDAKCLKLIFSENNWYLAIETKEEEFRLLRVSFIQSIGYGSKNTYQPHVLTKYRHYFETMQNPFTLHSSTLQTAILKASPKVAKYFQSHMKTFFLSQRHESTEADGSIVFSVSYTQPMEVLPFIKKWLPDIVILEPQSLITYYKEDLESALIAIKNH